MKNLSTNKHNTESQLSSKKVNTNFKKEKQGLMSHRLLASARRIHRLGVTLRLWLL